MSYVSMDKLKPCPFCGRPAKLYVSGQGVAVVCTGAYSLTECGCMTPIFDDQTGVDALYRWKYTQTAVERAIEVWNRRA